MTDSIGQRVGERVNRTRKSKGWSQRMLGMRAKTSGSYISQLEAGLLSRPGIEQLRRIAEALGITLEELAGAEGSDGDKVGENQTDETASALASSHPKSVFIAIQEDLIAIGELDPEELELIAAVLRLRREKLYQKLSKKSKGK